MNEALKPDAQTEIDTFLRTVAEAQRSLLLLDYDGTLAPFRKNRAAAVPYPGVVPALQAIIENGRTRVVIISGRDARDVVRLLKIQPVPEVWGLHGSQRLKPGGSSVTLPLEERAMAALGVAGRWLDYQQLRHTAEPKTGSIAVHWRGLANVEAEEIRSRVLMGWLPIAKGAGLSLLEFDGGVEVRATRFNKGDTVRVLVGEMKPGTPVAYLGDDNTDEPAFRTVDGSGLSVLVRQRSRRTAAKLWLKPPGEMLDFMDQWLAACRGQEALGREAAVARTG
ncbi:MAG: trehalose-phosphatase [Acidobacteriia bacterium]|nr:trehalose-phosphatase [Terriglobia bacterium]